MESPRVKKPREPLKAAVRCLRAGVLVLPSAGSDGGPPTDAELLWTLMPVMLTLPPLHHWVCQESTTCEHPAPGHNCVQHS